MHIAFRADASPEIGSGHLMRCVTLANALAGRGAMVTFLTRPGAAPLLEMVRARGYGVRILSDDPRKSAPSLDLDRGEFFIRDTWSIWSGTSLYKLYSQACTPYEWYAPIFACARELGMVPFSTPFNSAAIDFLETLDPACYKIASFENIDLPLIGKAAATGKSLVVSTGMATIAELDETVRTARKSGCRDLILLKCTSTHPATPENSIAQRRILLAEVHPDDEACGGTIARHALSSDKLQVILLTNGVGAMDEKDIPGASRCRCAPFSLRHFLLLGTAVAAGHPACLLLLTLAV